MIILFLLIVVINFCTTFVLIKFVHEQSEELYELRARVLELEMKNIKKPATVHRIK
jgi:hypothetical protein